MTALVSLIFNQGMIFILIGLVSEVVIIGLIVSLVTKWSVKKTIQNEFELNDELKKQSDEKLKDDIKAIMKQSKKSDKGVSEDLDNLMLEQKKTMKLVQYLVKEQKRSGK